MTKIDTSTKAVERLLEGVTPGPWTVEYRNETICLFMGDSCEMCDETYDPWVPSNHYDWHFFAAARTLVPALLKERDEARARAAAAFEMAAKVCTSIITDYDVMKADGKTYETLRVQKAAKGLVSLARQDIRDLATDQDRDALAKVQAGAMREAAGYCADKAARRLILSRADEIEKGEL